MAATPISRFYCYKLAARLHLREMQIRLVGTACILHIVPSILLVPSWPPRWCTQARPEAQIAHARRQGTLPPFVEPLQYSRPAPRNRAVLARLGPQHCSSAVVLSCVIPLFSTCASTGSLQAALPAALASAPPGPAGDVAV